ncbi:RING-H2 finger protein [Arachis hypogaea]|nr:RING-H2 finger protein [Arachis hypogaea]
MRRRKRKNSELCISSIIFKVGKKLVFMEEEEEESFIMHALNMAVSKSGAGEFFPDKKHVRNSLVTVGAFITTGVLTARLISFRRGNSHLGQKLMRACVVVQGATVALVEQSDLPDPERKGGAEILAERHRGWQGEVAGRDVTRGNRCWRRCHQRRSSVGGDR